MTILIGIILTTFIILFFVLMEFILNPRKGKRNIDAIVKKEETPKDAKDIRDIDLKVYQLVEDCTKLKLLHNSCLKKNDNGECVFKDKKRCIKYKYELADIAKEFCKYKVKLLEFKMKEENKSLSFYIARIIRNIDTELVTLRPIGEIPEEIRKYIPETVSDEGCRKPKEKTNPIAMALVAPIATPFMLFSLLISICPYILIAIVIIFILAMIAIAGGISIPFFPFFAL